MPTHEEMITPLKFDESFKALLREFYCYGFRAKDQIGSKSESTVEDDWNRLYRILNQYEHDYMHWDEGKNGNIVCTTTDSRFLPFNPFHNVYRFCSCSGFEILLEAVAILSPKIRIRREIVESDEESVLAELEFEMGMSLDEAKEDRGLKTSEFLDMCCSRHVSEYKDPHKAINNKLRSLSDQDILLCKQSRGVKGGPGDKKWILNKLTMNEIIQEGKKKDPEFRDHFISALDFYSRYYFLGEVGAFLLDRLRADDSRQMTKEKSFLHRTLQEGRESGPGVKYESPFRFRQEYFIQALNDFDLLDLLGAIESGSWCLIEYRHAYADKEAKNVHFLCFPLEIRISAANGREYLMYYDPIIRSCMSLRVDFICRISIFSDTKVKSVLAKSKLKRSAEEIDDDIQKAGDMIGHVWGVSTSVNGGLEENVINGQKLYDVKMTVQYDPEKEPYVINRLWREGRSGTVREIDGPGPEKTAEYDISVYDPKEMNAWIHSYESRIISLVNFPRRRQSKNNSPEETTDKKPGEDAAKNNYQKWDVPAEIIYALGSGKKASRHQQIFNETFSVYGQILATIFTYMITTGEWKNDEEWNREFKRWKSRVIQASDSAGMYTGMLWEKEFTAESIKEIFLYKDEKDGGRLKCKFEWNEEKLGTGGKHVSFYGDILPLTGIEVRWLKTILSDDDKIKCFLSKEEINAVREVLNTQRPEDPELPARKIIYFDRYKFPKEYRRVEQDVVREFLDILRNQEKAYVEFQAIPNNDLSSDIFIPLKKDDAMTGFPNMETFSGTFIPLIILFSKRNNFFTLCFWSCDDHRICFVNAARVTGLAGTGEKIDQTEQESAEKTLSDYYAAEKQTVELDFTEGQRISDRLLMQFSPWEKDCTFYSSLKKYKLTLSYLTEDEPGLIVRLLGYMVDRSGANQISIKPPDNRIAKEIKRRKKRQQELFDLMGDPEISGDLQPGKGR